MLLGDVAPREMTNTHDPNCTRCGAALDADGLDAFPGGLCLACYKTTPEANAPLTSTGLKDLTRKWAGR